MLVIRMQRTGRKGHAQFRIIVQESRLTPTSGKVVAPLGSYDPHAKTVILDKEKVAFYLEHGAQPSGRVAHILQAEGVKLPSWVKLRTAKDRTVKNADKRRSTRPAEEAAPEAPAEKPATEPVEETATETVETVEETTTEAAPAEEAAAEPEVKA